MASLTQWTWVWVNFRSWWWTERPGVLQFMGSQRVGHDWATELKWTELKDHIQSKAFLSYSVAWILALQNKHFAYWMLKFNYFKIIDLMVCAYFTFIYAGQCIIFWNKYSYKWKVHWRKVFDDSIWTRLYSTSSSYLPEKAMATHSSTLVWKIS